MTGLALDTMMDYARNRLDGLDPGQPLSVADGHLVDFAVATSASCLDMERAEEAGRSALENGLTPAHLHNALELVTCLGVHSLMEGSALVQALAGAPKEDLDAEREALWQRHVAADPYWIDFEKQVPGFLDALVRQSPTAFTGFFALGALPWRSRTLSAVQMELISIAVDSTPSHRYGPGFRHHVENALKVGASPRQILETMERSAAGPEHPGVA